jgi:DNA-binding MarR family transcriptional regulator
MSNEASLPALLRAARAVFAGGIRRGLAAAGYHDIPANGLAVMTAIARAPAPLGDIVELLGVSKQATSQLVDAMFVRGYLERTPDTEDRRRLNIAATARGRAAAKIIRSVVKQLEADLSAQVGAESVAHTRATLQTLIDINPTKEAT